MIGIKLLRQSGCLPKVIRHLRTRHVQMIHTISPLLQVDKRFRLQVTHISRHPCTVHIRCQQHSQLHPLQLQVIQLHPPVNRARIFRHRISQQHLKVSIPQQRLVYHSKPILQVRTVGIKTQFRQLSLDDSSINHPLRVQLRIIQMNAIHLCLQLQQRQCPHTDIQLTGIQHRVALMNRQNATHRQVKRELQMDTLHRDLHPHFLTQPFSSLIHCKFLHRWRVNQHEKQQE